MVWLSLLVYSHPLRCRKTLETLKEQEKKIKRKNAFNKNFHIHSGVSVCESFFSGGGLEVLIVDLVYEPLSDSMGRRFGLCAFIRFYGPPIRAMCLYPILWASDSGYVPLSDSMGLRFG